MFFVLLQMGVQLAQELQAFLSDYGLTRAIAKGALAELIIEGGALPVDWNISCGAKTCPTELVERLSFVPAASGKPVALYNPPEKPLRAENYNDG